MTSCLPAKKAAAYLDMSLSSLYVLVNERAIECERPPHGHIRIPVAALDAFKKSFTVPAVPRIRRIRTRKERKPRIDRAAVAASVSRRFELARPGGER